MLAVKWVAPNGTEIDLNDQTNTNVMVGITGDFMPEYKLIEQRSPVVAGAYVMDVAIEPRDLHLPVIIQDENRALLMERVRAMMRSLSPDAGEGRLVINSDGVERVLYCRYKSGLKDDGNAQDQQANYVKAMLTFRASDPFFYAPESNSVQFSNTTEFPGFFPILPVILVNPRIYAQAEINNPGDVYAWPLITVTGPGKNIEIANLTTSKFMKFDLTLPAGVKLVVNTRPRFRSVKSGSGSNMFHFLTPDSALFPLQRGINVIRIAMTDVSESSLVQFMFTPAYLSV